MKIITTSWDDGHKESKIMAELLYKYNLQGTFYVPSNALVGKKVEIMSPDEKFLSKKELQVISKDFEVGAHGVTHRFLNDVSKEEAKKEIEWSKKTLENMIEKEIHGFAYPGGKFNEKIIELVKNANYSYARTVGGGKLDFSERFKVPTTLFCYNNLIRRIKFSFLAPFSEVFAFGGDWIKSVLKAFENLKQSGGVLHIAEHPKSLRNSKFRENIEKVFSQISNHPDIEYLNNKETVEKVLGAFAK